MKKIRLLHIQLLPELWGAQMVMMKLLAGLDQDRYEIFVMSRSPGRLISRLQRMNISHLPLNSLKQKISFSDFIAFFQILYICRTYRFDIVHTHSSKPGFLGRIAARTAGIKKVIHTSHGFPFNDFQPWFVRFFYQTLERFAGLFCDFVVYVNEHDRECAIRSRLIPPKKAITIYNGIELPSKKEPKIKNRFIIGSAFRFCEQKNPLNTIKAAIEVCRKNPLIDFILLGEGELLSQCRAIVIDFGMQKRIFLKGRVENVNEHLLEFDVFLLFSRWEALPVSILEAMSVGLPIIASDINGNRELVNGNGLLISLNDVDKLINILSDLPHKINELKLWSEKSYQIVKEKFSLPGFISAYQRLYLE